MITDEKIKLIDELVSKHPSYGVENGWSTYTGGMADTGSWFYRRIMDEPDERIKALLDYINSEESRVVKNDSFKEQRERMKTFFDDIERKLMFGK